MTFPFFKFGNNSNDIPAGGFRRRLSRALAPDIEAELPDGHPDRVYVERVRAGDADAFGHIFKEYYQRLWAFGYDLTGSADLADEVVQDVFAALWTRHADWRVSHSIAEYLFGAVRNRAYKVRRHLAVVERTAADVDAGGTVPALGVPPVGPADAVEHADLDAYVADAVRAMPPGRRTALLLRWHDQLSYSEIAAIMGISAKAVSFQLSRARDDLWALVKNRI